MRIIAVNSLALVLLFAAASMAQIPERTRESCEGVVPATFARDFANEWIAAWNYHDLDRILAHYSDAFEMRSPGIVSVAGEPSGVLIGKPKVRAYWTAALKAQPDLKFELIGVYAGVKSVAIHYRTRAGRMVVEVLEFNSDCEVVRGSAIREAAP